MADFNFYLNRQGIQGVQGERGNDGFTPVIEEGTNTSDTYTLKITNEYDTIETPNLRGSFTITDNGGKYVMYIDSELQANDPINATGETAGVLRIAQESDYNNPSETAAVAINPLGLYTALPQIIQSESGSIVISTTLDDKTNLELGTTIKIGDTTLSEAQLIKLLALIEE